MIVRAAEGLSNMMEHRSGRRFDGIEADAHRALEKKYGPPFQLSSFWVPPEVWRQHIATRIMTTIPGAKGGYLVETTPVSFIDQLQNTSVCLASGAQFLTSPANENVVVTKQLSGPNFSWIQAGVASSVADPTFGEISASPKILLAQSELSEQLMRLGGPVAEAFLRRQLALGMAAGVDLAMLVGLGGAQPLGNTNTPGINTIVGTALDRAKAIDFQTQAANANAIIDPNSQAYITTPTVAALLAGRQEFTGVATTLWGGSIVKGKVVGTDARSTKAMTAGSMVFGDFSQSALIEFGAMAIAVNSSDTNFNKGVIAIRALWMLDVIVTEPKSFTLASSVT